MSEKSVNITIQVGVKGAAEKDKLIKNLEKLGNTASKTGKKTQASLKDITPTMQKLWQEADKLGAHWGVSMQTALPYIKKLGDAFKANTTDTYQLAQAADFVSKKFKVSFKSTYDTLKQMGVGLNGVSFDTDKAAKAARKFSASWGVSFQDAFKYQVKLGTGVKQSTGKIKAAMQSTSHDIDKTAKTARAFAENWNVSFTKAHGYISRLGATTKKVTNTVYNDVDRTSKIARKFSQNWGVSFSSAYKSVNKLGIGVKKTEKQVGESGKNMNLNFTLIAWHFRFLGNIFDRVASSMVRMIKDVIKVSSELEEAFLSISTAGAIFGKDADRATEFSKELARTGLMPLKESANSVKNLMITGLGLPELEKFTYRYLDVAFLFTSGADEMSKSLETISKSILKGTMQLATDSTAKELWIATEKRLEKTIGVTMKQITAKQRAMELLTTIETKWAATQGLHEMEIETTRAAMTRLNFAITEIKNSLGVALLPILHAVSNVLVRFSVYITSLLDTLGPTVPIVVALAVAVSFLIAKLSFAIGVFISLMKVASLTAMTMWKIALPMMAIGALVVGATYLYLKYSGALDKASDSAGKMKNQLAELSTAFQEMDEGEAEEADDSRRLAHERATEDIMEDLEKERSKGLWANQMSIKDLEKRLKRENEDWDLYLKGLGDKDVSDPTAGLSIYDEMLVDANAAAEGLNNIDFWKGFKEKTEEMWAWLRESKNWNNVGRKIANLFITFGTWARDAWLMAWNDWIKYIFTPGFWGELANNIKLVAVTIWDGLKEGLKGFGDEVADWILGPTDKMFERLNKNTTDLISKAKELQDLGETEKARKLLEMDVEQYQNIADTYNNLSDDLSFENIMGDVGNKIWDWTEKFLPPISGEESGQPSWLNFKTGGIVPGLTNQAVPIIAHGGEKIIPAGEVANSEGITITINMNNPIVREEEDLNKIARAVSNVLGRRQNFSRLGAF